MNCMSVQQEKNYNSSSGSGSCSNNTNNNINNNSQYHHKDKRNTSTHNTREFQSQTSRVGGFRSCLRGEIEEAESKSTIFMFKFMLERAIPPPLLHELPSTN